MAVELGQDHGRVEMTLCHVAPILQDNGGGGGGRKPDPVRGSEAEGCLTRVGFVEVCLCAGHGVVYSIDTHNHFRATLIFSPPLLFEERGP